MTLQKDTCKIDRLLRVLQKPSWTTAYDFQHISTKCLGSPDLAISNLLIILVHYNLPEVFSFNQQMTSWHFVNSLRHSMKSFDSVITANDFLVARRCSSISFNFLSRLISSEACMQNANIATYFMLI